MSVAKKYWMITAEDTHWDGVEDSPQKVEEQEEAQEEVRKSGWPVEEVVIGNTIVLLVQGTRKGANSWVEAYELFGFKAEVAFSKRTFEQFNQEVRRQQYRLEYKKEEVARRSRSGLIHKYHQEHQFGDQYDAHVDNEVVEVGPCWLLTDVKAEKGPRTGVVVRIGHETSSGSIHSVIGMTVKAAEELLKGLPLALAVAYHEQVVANQVFEQETVEAG